MKKEKIAYAWKDRKRFLGLPLSFTRYMLSEDRLFLSWHGCKMRLRKCGNVRLRRKRYAILVHANGPETILRWEVYRCLM